MMALVYIISVILCLPVWIYLQYEEWSYRFKRNEEITLADVIGQTLLFLFILLCPMVNTIAAISSICYAIEHGAKRIVLRKAKP